MLDVQSAFLPLLGAKFSDNTIDTRRVAQIASSQLTRFLAEDTLHADERSFNAIACGGAMPMIVQRFTAPVRNFIPR
jgi:hypothetical protein